MAFIQASVQPYENKATVTNREHCNVRPDIWLTHTNNLALIELKAKYSSLFNKHNKRFVLPPHPPLYALGRFMSF